MTSYESMPSFESVTFMIKYWWIQFPSLLSWSHSTEIAQCLFAISQEKSTISELTRNMIFTSNQTMFLAGFWPDCVADHGGDHCGTSIETLQRRPGKYERHRIRKSHQVIRSRLFWFRFILVLFRVRAYLSLFYFHEYFCFIGVSTKHCIWNQMS